MNDYMVPVTVNGHAPGQTATVTICTIAYRQASDVAARHAIEEQLTMMSQLLSPNELVAEFQVGQPVAIAISQVL